MRPLRVPVQLEDDALARVVAWIAVDPFCEHCRAPMELRPNPRGAEVHVEHHNDCPALRSPAIAARRTR